MKIEMACAPTLAPTAELAVTTAASLADAFHREARLLDDLGVVLRRQRNGVAGDDVQAVDESVFAAHRVMRTIEEARRRRRTLIGILTGAEDVSIHDLDEALGVRMTGALTTGRDDLESAALALSREIAINREVLRAAIETGDEFVRALCGAPAAPVSGYGERTTHTGPAGGGVLLNQRV
jgi:hypothetical protein